MFVFIIQMLLTTKLLGSIFLTKTRDKIPEVNKINIIKYKSVMHYNINEAFDRM